MKNLAVFVLVSALVGFAGTTARAAQSCSASAYHQYDYFVGTWNVYNRQGKKFAVDRVTRELDGCAIWERWNGSHGKGLGYSAYDRGRGRWFQAFFGDDGSVLRLDGTLTPKGLFFTGDSYPEPGKTEMNRVLFRRMSKNEVEEFWTISDNGGKTWKTAFDGFFRRS